MEKIEVNEKQSSIQIEKNSRGYNWSIKLYYNEEKTKYSDVIDRLNIIDKDLKAKFEGGSNVE